MVRERGHASCKRMIPKSMPSGDDPMGGHRFSEKTMRKQTLYAASWRSTYCRIPPFLK